MKIHREQIDRDDPRGRGVPAPDLFPAAQGRRGRPLPLLGVALAAWVAGCGGDVQADGTTEEAGFQRVINVEVLTVEPQDFQERIRITGTVQANQDVVVSAEESGVVREILVEKGAAVTAGQPLLRVDDRILRAQVAEAEARAALARESWERRRRLFEEDGVGTELAYLEARYQAEQTEAVLATLAERLDRSVVRAPIPGILESRDVEVGTMVAAGTPVARIVQIDPVKVSGGVPERFAADVARGSRATVSFDVLRDERFQAGIAYVGATVNPRNRTFDVELVLPNPGRVIKPEMVANIEIVRRDQEGVIVVPQEAVVRVEDGFVAFVVEQAGGGEVARSRVLTLGSAQRNQLIVESGLDPGDRLIVVGQNQVANGDRVQIVRTREPEQPAGGDR